MTKDSRNGIRTTSRARKVAVALACATAIAAALPGLALPSAGAASGAEQVVRGTVSAQFGVSVAPDGTASASASTIPVSVTRTREDGVEVVTVAPLR